MCGCHFRDRLGASQHPQVSSPGSHRPPEARRHRRAGAKRDPRPGRPPGRRTSRYQRHGRRVCHPARAPDHGRCAAGPAAGVGGGRPGAADGLRQPGAHAAGAHAGPPAGNRHPRCARRRAQPADAHGVHRKPSAGAGGRSVRSGAGGGLQRRSPAHGPGPHSAPGAAGFRRSCVDVRAGLIDSVWSSVRPAGLCPDVSRAGRSSSRAIHEQAAVAARLHPDRRRSRHGVRRANGSHLAGPQLCRLAQRRPRLPVERRTGDGGSHAQPPVQALPGVEGVAMANCAPMSLSPTGRFRFATRFGIEGRTFDPGRYPVAQYRWVTPEYFRILQIPLKRGRLLAEADRDHPRYMINETLARRFFPHEDPTAHRLIMGVMDPHRDLIEIAGVVGDVRDMGLDEPVPPTLYMISSSPRMILLVKTAGDPMRLAAPIRDAIHRADPEVAVLKAAPVAQYVADSLARRRFALTLLAAFGGLAALLTAAGIYGLLAYSVSGRAREFGIRAALGATPANLLRMILKEGAAVTIPGLAVGIAVSLACARLMRSLLYHLSPMDPLSLAAAGVLLSVIAWLSVWRRARRAARVDPGAAFRVE